MSHELDFSTGRAAIAYVGDEPWHGYGEKIAVDASLDEWITKAGMGYTLLKSRVRYYTEKDDSGQLGGIVDFDGKVAIFRNDTKKGMGIVSDDFQIVQPRENVAFIYDICERAGLKMSTAGALFDGRKFWALCDIGAESKILDEKDRLKAHLMMSTACDGSQATEWRYCMVRTVCNNTLTMNQRAGAAKIKITHRSKVDYDKVREALGIEGALSTFESTIRDMIALAEKPVKESGAIALTAKLLHDDFAELDSDKKAKILRSKPVEAIGRLALDKGAATGSELTGAYGTAWGWLNAVTEYVDHSAGRSTTTFDNRLNSAYFGKGAELKERAYMLAESYTPTLDDIIASTNAMMRKPAATSAGAALLDSVIAETIL